MTIVSDRRMMIGRILLYLILGGLAIIAVWPDRAPRPVQTDHVRPTPAPEPTAPPDPAAQQRAEEQAEQLRREADAAVERNRHRGMTIDARDEGGVLIGPVNIWDDYASRRRIIASLSHGTRVLFVRRAGDGVEVELPDGQHGWVSYWFIKELR